MPAIVEMRLRRLTWAGLLALEARRLLTYARRVG